MPISEIATLLTSMKAASDIGRHLIDMKATLDKTEVTAKLVELLEKLTDARAEALDAQQMLAAHDAEIARLQDALELKGGVVKVRDGIFLADESGKAAGDAFCIRCWERDHRLRSLVFPEHRNKPATCKVCSSNYTFDRVLLIP